MFTVIFGVATAAAYHLEHYGAAVFLGCVALCMLALEAGKTR